MIKNQLARRNLTDSQRRYFIGKRYEEEKKEVEEFKGNQYTKNGGAQSEQKQTAEKIAKENNTSQATVRRNADYSKAIDEIKKHQPEVQETFI